jgi:hypothetical protein
MVRGTPTPGSETPFKKPLPYNQITKLNHYIERNQNAKRRPSVGL